MKKQVVLKNDHVTPPAAVFKSCPIKECKSKDLFDFDGDVFCNDCGWNSIESRVSANIDDHVERYRQEQQLQEFSHFLPYGSSLGMGLHMLCVGVS